MKKIKEHNYVMKNESEQIIIRSIKNADLYFYKNWFKNGHIIKEAVNAISEKEIENWILHDTKTQYIFIIEFNKTPCGEIVLWNDNALIVLDKFFKKPYYSIMIKFYESVQNNDIDDVLNLFLESIKHLKMKICSIYALTDEKEEQNYTENYLRSGFKYLNNESFKTKLEKTFVKNNMKNPYKKLKMLIKCV